MADEKTWLSCKEAAELLNFTQRHISNLIKNGKISATKDEYGKYYIQRAEFFRAYPDTMDVEKTRNERNLVRNEELKALEEKVRHLEEMVDERKRINEFLVEQININTQEKSKMLDAINNHSRLLEFKETRENMNSSKGFSWWPFKKK